jgi:putative Mg2+ transporter-C (MgtC) family protein
MLELYFLGQVALGFLLGAILGWQREQSGHVVGPRTFALVAGGAALFTLISKHIFGLNDAPLIGQIITGIGFIGAGTIIHHDNRVEGITTAAGLWIATAIGITVGLEAYILAIGTAILSLGILLISNRPNKLTKTKSTKKPLINKS